MSPRLALITGLLLIAVGALAWLGLGASNDDAPACEADGESTAGLAPTLEGRGDGAKEAAPSADAATTTNARPSDGRTWVLHVEFQTFACHIWGVDWDEEPIAAGAKSAFEGRRIRVELTRGDDRRVLARGVLDARGRARFELPELSTMSPLARSCSRLHAVPEDEDVILGGRRQNYIFGRRDVSIRSAAPPARPEGSTVTMYLVVPALTGSLVVGQAVRPDGEPAANAKVSTYSADGGDASDTCTDGEGRFAITVTKAGTFDLSVQAKDGSSVRREGLRLAAGAQLDLGVLQMSEEEVVFAGRITYPDGAPVAGLAIEASHTSLDMHVSYMPPTLACDTYGIGRSTHTDARGRYRIYPRWVGGRSLWSLRTSFEGDARTEPHLGFPKRSREDLDAVMHGHRIRLRVVDEDRAPVHEARIVLHPLLTVQESQQERKRKPVETDTDRHGRADVWLTHASRWTLSVIAPGGTPLERSLEVQETGNESDLVLRVTPLGYDTGVRVTLQSAEGAKLMPAVLRVWTVEGAEIWWRRVDTAGFYLALAPGRYRVHLRSIERAPWAKGEGRWQHHHGEVEVPPEGVVDLRPVVAEAAHLEVTLRHPSQAGAQDGPWHPRVFLEHAKTGREVEDFLSRPYEGRATDIVSGDLEPGAWTVRFEASGYRSVTRKIELVGGELGQVEFVLERD